MNKSESISEIATALAIAQGKISGAVKDCTNPHFKSKYADLESIVTAIKQPFSENGLSFIQVSHNDQNAVSIETIIMHKSGEWISNGIFSVPVSKNDAHGYGSALTYARRYSLSTAAGVAPEDDDGNGASKDTEKKGPQNAAENNLPEGFLQYEADVLPLMSEAANKGMQALTEEFGKLVKHPCRSPFWTKHGPALKEQALKAKI